MIFVLRSVVKFALQLCPSRKLSPLFSADPRFSCFSPKNGLIAPLESALIDAPVLSSLESALTKNRGEGGTPSLLSAPDFPAETAWGIAGDWQRWLQVRGSGDAAGRGLGPSWP